MKAPRPSLRLLVLAALTATLASATLASAASASPAPTGGFLDPKDPMFEGPSYLSLTVTGDPDRVRVRSHGTSAFGHFAPHSSNTIRPGKVWDFGKRRVDRTRRMKRMLGKVFHEYDKYGTVDIRVRVYSGSSSTNWRCALSERTAESGCELTG